MILTWLMRVLSNINLLSLPDLHGASVPLFHRHFHTIVIIMVQWSQLTTLEE